MKKKLYRCFLKTPLGEMVAVCDSEYLYVLEFLNTGRVEREYNKTEKLTGCEIVEGRTDITDQIESELKAYFAGECLAFETPLFKIGSDFQKTVWQALQTIPTGETRSYLDMAKQIKKPTACRAVANANGANQLAIIIPCHRVINESGKLGGYGGGVSRKAWLLQHERKFSNS